MKLFFTLATFLFAAHAYASVECTLPANEAVIESTVEKLSLTPDGKELVQTLALGQPGTKLIVKSNVTDKSGTTTLKGDVKPVVSVACPGSCPTTTFELVISAASNGITPNGTLTKVTSGFNEMSGINEVHKMTWDFVCTIH